MKFEYNGNKNLKKLAKLLLEEMKKDKTQANSSANFGIDDAKTMEEGCECPLAALDEGKMAAKFEYDGEEQMMKLAEMLLDGYEKEKKSKSIDLNYDDITKINANGIERN